MAPNKSRPKAVTTMSLRVLRKIFVCFMGCTPFCYIRSLGKYFKPVECFKISRYFSKSIFRFLLYTRLHRIAIGILLIEPYLRNCLQLPSQEQLQHSPSSPFELIWSPELCVRSPKISQQICSNVTESTFPAFITFFNLEGTEESSMACITALSLLHIDGSFSLQNAVCLRHIL